MRNLIVDETDKSQSKHAKIKAAKLKKITATIILTLHGVSLLSSCDKLTDSSKIDTKDSASPITNRDFAETKPAWQDRYSLEDEALTAYSALLSGDKSLLAQTQPAQWWVPDFKDSTIAYEYTYLDLDGDGGSELLIQMIDDPSGYNAVFHYQNGSLFCWNSDGVEMNCRDYPLLDGTMVRQYDYGGCRTYTIFRYQADGAMEHISRLFAREELLPADSALPCPYYEIDGNAVDKTTFDEQLTVLVFDRLLERLAWTAV